MTWINLLMSIEYNQDTISETVLRHGPKALELFSIKDDWIVNYLSIVDSEKLPYPLPKLENTVNQWLIPTEYLEMDIEGFLVDQCPKENYDRLNQELNLYRKHNMIELLKAVKYLVDTFEKNNIVWGVGRGSSVASYALHLLGLHMIDSVKYKLPIEEFFKEI